MTADPRAALDRLIAALEAHYTAVSTRRSDEDPRVDDAYDVLADAFEVYDDALARVYGEVTPFVLEEEDDEDDDDDDEDEDLDDEDADHADELDAQRG
ncbi:primosomal protein [Xylanimonas oleitrophica]|uniref:Primosomal protein n=1 Tax=Xylanimonas oleitrophica TaxID=2607479 RepID=A0A2W5Y3R7_9MICO|nr:primosomal protein [Xylanimonas oleitrophica]PZR52494.1 primosomal protein [Xylanimonas oleitrophica]